MGNEKRLIWDKDAQNRLVNLAVKRKNDMIPIDMITYILFYESLTVDAVEVVRCKNCGWYDHDCESCKFWGGYRDPEHFCGEGDKKNHEGKAD